MEKRYINNPPLKETPPKNTTKSKNTIIPESGTNRGSKVELHKSATLQVTPNLILLRVKGTPSKIPIPCKTNIKDFLGVKLGCPVRTSTN